MTTSLLGPNVLAGIGASLVVLAASLLLILRFEPTAKHPAMWALGVHILVSIVWVQTVGIGTDDALTYHRLAIQFSGVESPRMPDMETNIGFEKELYPRFLGLLYAVFGAHVLIALSINSAFFAGSVVIAELSARELGGSAAVVGWLALFLPSAYAFGSTPLREPAFWFASTALIYLGLRILNHFSLREATLFGLLSVAMLSLRGTAGIAVVVSIVAVVAAGRFAASRAQTGTPTLRWPIKGAIIGAILVIFINPLTVSLFERYSIGFLNLNRQYLSDAARTGFDVQEYTTIESVVTGVSFSFLRVLAAPFPGGTDVTGTPGMLLGLEWIFVMGIAALGLSLGRVKRYHAAVLVVPCATLLLAIAVVAGNYGLVFRLRAAALFMLLPLMGVAYCAMHDRWNTSLLKPLGFTK